MPTQYHCGCGHPLDLLGALDALPADHLGSAGHFVHACAGCGLGLEVRLRNGGYQVGFSYSAGSLHFEPLGDVVVKGLGIRASDPDDLEVRLGERAWHFGIRHPTVLTCVVATGAVAVGQPLSSLDLAHAGVTVTRVERAGTVIPAGPDLVLQAGDRLRLAGPDPAVGRVVRRIHQGDATRPRSRRS